MPHQRKVINEEVSAPISTPFASPMGIASNPRRWTAQQPRLPVTRVEHLSPPRLFSLSSNTRIRDLETQVELGEAAGRSHWVEANRRKLLKLTPIAELLRSGQIHQPMEKHKREYSPQEYQKTAVPSQEKKG